MLGYTHGVYETGVGNRVYENHIRLEFSPKPKNNIFRQSATQLIRSVLSNLRYPKIKTETQNVNF